MLNLRGEILGRIADYERAASLAERLARSASAEGSTFLARARTCACLHRFEEALFDLDHAARLGADGAELEAERAAIYQAIGRHDEALALRREAVDRCPDFETLWGLAALCAESGETVSAERLFDESRARFRGVSPFGLAQMDFQRGHMWQEEGDLGRARQWFANSLQRLPAYARAEGHLAEVEVALGQREVAIVRLRRLAGASDDPDYAVQLARTLRQADRPEELEEADSWVAMAKSRYEELMARHSAAFADHAAEFWLTVGDNPERAYGLARQNFEVRRTPRAHALLSRAALAWERRPVA